MIFNDNIQISVDRLGRMVDGDSRFLFSEENWRGNLHHGTARVDFG